MKKLSIALVVLLVLVGGAVYAGPFIGGEIIPSGGYGEPYLTIGWDSCSWIKTALTLSDPLKANSWYGLSVSPLYPLTPSFRIGGVASLWVQMDGWEFEDTTWAIGAEVVGKWKGIMCWLQFNLPSTISFDDPLFGTWVILGFGFDLSPCGLWPVIGWE